MLSVDAKAGTFLLEASVVAAAPGKIRKLSPPRRKVVRVTGATGPGGKKLADLKPGLAVRVVGEDEGVGKPMRALSIQAE